MVRKVLIIGFSFLVLSTVLSHAQRLNSEGLKMVERIDIDSRITILFGYDTSNRLNKVDITNCRDYSGLPTREVYSKNGRIITQSSYEGGKPYDRFEYMYRLNADEKIDSVCIIEHTEEPNCKGRNESELIYKDGVFACLKNVISTTEGKGWHYEPSTSELSLRYTNGNWYREYITYVLTDEQHRKYAPTWDEDEFIEGRGSMRKIGDSSDWQHEYVYSNDSVNDTNIGLNDLFLIDIHSMGYLARIENILFHTEWVGLRESKLVTKKRYGRRDYYVRYEYDSDHNITDMIYLFNGKEMNRLRIKYVN